MPLASRSAVGLSNACIVKPIASDETIAPTNNDNCWYLGVAPIRKPVFKSCDVAPALAAAIQTIPPTTSAIGSYIWPLQPTATKIRQVLIIVAIVIPEIGL